MKMKEIKVNKWLSKHPDLFEPLLGVEIGGDIEIEPISIGWPDFIARYSDSYIVFENQINKADKRHLGQILAYLYDKEKIKKGVWIAPLFGETMRTILERLNGDLEKEILGVQMRVKKSPYSICLENVNGERKKAISGGELIELTNFNPNTSWWRRLVTYYGCRRWSGKE